VCGKQSHPHTHHTHILRSQHVSWHTTTTRNENAPNKLGSPESQTCLGIFGVVIMSLGTIRDENTPNKLGSPESQTCLGYFPGRRR
jgi:hypothetical protein